MPKVSLTLSWTVEAAEAALSLTADATTGACWATVSCALVAAAWTVRVAGEPAGTGDDLLVAGPARTRTEHVADADGEQQGQLLDRVVPHRALLLQMNSPTSATEAAADGAEQQRAAPGDLLLGARLDVEPVLQLVDGGGELVALAVDVGFDGGGAGCR